VSYIIFKKQTLRIFLWLFIFVIITGFLAIYYIFNMPHRNISKEKAVYTLDARQLISEFHKDEAAATSKYLDRTISVKGEIRSIRSLENHTIVFSLEDAMEGVSCIVDSADASKNVVLLSQFKKNSIVTFKGRCSGMLMDIQVINCVPE
jgi:hypothetical protein